MQIEVALCPHGEKAVIVVNREQIILARTLIKKIAHK